MDDGLKKFEYIQEICMKKNGLINNKGMANRKEKGKEKGMISGKGKDVEKGKDIEKPPHDYTADWLRMHHDNYGLI
jgi:hypothetical protein